MCACRQLHGTLIAWVFRRFLESEHETELVLLHTQRKIHSLEERLRVKEKQYLQQVHDATAFSQCLTVASLLPCFAVRCRVLLLLCFTTMFHCDVSCRAAKLLRQPPVDSLMQVASC